MPEAELSDLSIVLTFVREGQGWNQAQLASAAGISRKVLNDLERGRRRLTREKVETLIAWMGVPPERIDATLDLLAANRASTREPPDLSDPQRKASAQVEAIAGKAARLTADYTRALLTLLTTEGEALKARQKAETLWNQLKRHSPIVRRQLVEDGMKYRTWALCERVAAESVGKAPNHPKEAQELAELALLIAELTPGEDLWRQRIAGFAGIFLGNARRACNNLPGADQALSRARKLFEAGAPGDPGFLNEAWLPALESSLRRAQRRFPEALKRIEEALALDRGELRAQILLNKSRLHETLGDPEASMLALLEAAPLINPTREPRDAFGLRFNLAAAFCALERFEDAEARLPEVRTLAERRNEELDITRSVWLQGKVDAGLGRSREARAAFEQVRRVFRARELAFDYALVCLDLALILLGQGDTGEVRALAEEMLTIFRSQQVEREPLAALQFFCEAAKREAASVELARRVVKYLNRAQHDPELQFDDDQGAKA
ncbi:MAG TPA: helix-turn-helix transcriptional regulator [Thermoanaerobaculia bacterium]|jgi:transcriptional regulator with XRE-family HTH domain|nr:helix-turn-helix transcriptional regulator [Thermoanaerobaculia bacterium]